MLGIMVNSLLSVSPEAEGTKPPIVPRRVGRNAELMAQMELLFARMRVAVIYGGDKSSEGAVINRTPNTRPWKSYQAVAEDIAESLSRIGFQNVSLMADDMRLGENLRQQQIHMAWLNTGGVQGYNPVCHASSMLELFGIPYVGHDPLIGSTLDNKHLFKRELDSIGIRTAPFMTWHLSRGPFLPDENERFRRIFVSENGPYIVKPVSGRASLHVKLVENKSDLTDAVAEVYDATHNHVLIESYLPGREYCIAACGPVTARAGNLEQGNGPFVFAASERVLAEDEKIFTSMDVRPITSERVRPLNKKTDIEIIGRLECLARDVFTELHIETLIRLDVRSDEVGNLIVLEANPKPDLKVPTENQTSLICECLEEIGMTYDDLILSLIADRIDLLFSQKRGTVTHLLSLLD